MRKLRKRPNETWCLKLTTAKGYTGKILGFGYTIQKWEEGKRVYPKDKGGFTWAASSSPAGVHGLNNVSALLNYFPKYFTIDEVKRYGYAIWLGRGRGAIALSEGKIAFSSLILVRRLNIGRIGLASSRDFTYKKDRLLSKIEKEVRSLLPKRDADHVLS